MTLDERLTQAAQRLAGELTPPDVDLDAIRSTARANQRRKTVLVVAAAVVGVIVAATAIDVGRETAAKPPSPTTPVGTDGVVWAAERQTAPSTQITEPPDRTLPSEAEMLRDPHTEPLPPWSAFDPETGGFLWAELPLDPDMTFSSDRTLMVRSPGTGSELTQIECSGLCTDVVSFGPGPDEVTVLVADLERDPVNPGPESIARVYGFDGSLRDEIDLAGVMGTERLISDETGDWIPPDGTESLISDIEWAPDGTQLAVATYPGFFEADCLPEAESCDARIWTFDRDGGDPVAVHYQLSEIREGGVWLAPILTDLAWTSDGSRLGMVLTSDNQDGDKPPPRLLARYIGQVSSASILYRFDDCGSCRPARYGFAWAPDGGSVAVTNGDDLSLIRYDGIPLSELAEGGPGPLAWLD